MLIRSERDLKTAYDALSLCRTLKEAMPHNITHNFRKYEADLKRDVRRYNKRKLDRVLIKGDCDGYVEKINLPEYIKNKDEAIDYLNGTERLVCRPSQYDCTGQAFTISFAVTKRGGRYVAYHTVGLDV